MNVAAPAYRIIHLPIEGNFTLKKIIVNERTIQGDYVENSNELNIKLNWTETELWNIKVELRWLSLDKVN